MSTIFVRGALCLHQGQLFRVKSRLGCSAQRMRSQDIFLCSTDSVGRVSLPPHILVNIFQTSSAYRSISFRLSFKYRLIVNRTLFNYLLTVVHSSSNIFNISSNGRNHSELFRFTLKVLFQIASFGFPKGVTGCGDGECTSMCCLDLRVRSF